ncbi:MAG: RDD family protein [Flavobacteriales bacterium]|jgi:uncharacterized RDD family membrane protein YckC
MKTVDIKTTQNVPISYELAPVRDRIVAFVLDSVFKSIATGVLAILLTMIFNLNDTSGILLFGFLIFPIITFYTLFFEIILQGQTPAKKLMRIKVIKLNGKQAQVQDYLLRWVFRLVDIYLTAGISGVMMMVSSPTSQRAGDLLSNTIVIKSDARISISLKEILRIDSRNSYVPQYPGIKSFREEDIILIKATLDRFAKYRNDAHAQAIQELARVLSERLGIQAPSTDKVGFLKTLIKDYIVLTR